MTCYLIVKLVKKFVGDDDATMAKSHSLSSRSSHDMYMRINGDDQGNGLPRNIYNETNKPL